MPELLSLDDPKIKNKLTALKTAQWIRVPEIIDEVKEMCGTNVTVLLSLSQAVSDEALSAKLYEEAQQHMG